MTVRCGWDCSLQRRERTDRFPRRDARSRAFRQGVRMAATQITVQRCDAGTSSEPYWQTYAVDVRGNETVLDALLLIADRIDPTLAFRRTCRSGICGSCAGQVNGRACLLCQLSIDEARRESEHTPL